MDEQITNQNKYLLLLEPSVKSLSKRVFYIFKPKDIIKGERFNIKIIITNKSDKPFPGGSIIKPLLSHGRDANGIIDELQDKTIPIIFPNENCILDFNNWHAYESGIIGIELDIKSDDKGIVKCYQKSLGSNTLELYKFSGKWLGFIHVSSKSEIQQRYTNNILIILTILTTIYYILTLFVELPLQIPFCTYLQFLSK